MENGGEEWDRTTDATHPCPLYRKTFTPGWFVGLSELPLRMMGSPIRILAPPQESNLGRAG